MTQLLSQSNAVPYEHISSEDEIIGKSVHIFVENGLSSKCFLVKRHLLSENSEVLKASLAELDNRTRMNFDDTNTEPIVSVGIIARGLEIRNVHPKVFKEVIELLKHVEMKMVNPFTGRRVDFVPNIVYPIGVLLAAKKLEMAKVTTFAIQSVLKDNINFPKRCPSVYEIIKHSTFANVIAERSRVEEKIIRWFECISRTQYFGIFSFESLKMFLEHPHLWIEDEIELFRGLIRWATVKCQKQELEVSNANLRSILGNLIYLIRFPLMTLEEFETEVEPISILQPLDCKMLKDYFNLKKTDRKAANALILPYEKSRRAGHQFVADIFVKRFSEFREWPSKPFGKWERIRIWTTRAIEIDTIIMSGRVDTDGNEGGGLEIRLGWKKYEGSSQSKFQTVVAEVGTDGKIYVRLPIPLKAKSLKDYQLKFNFVSRGILSRASTFQYCFSKEKHVSVNCQNRGLVQVYATNCADTCSFRGIEFRLLSKWTSKFEAIY